MIHLHLKRPEESSGGEQSCSREREGGQDWGKDTEMKSSGDLLCISSPLVGAEANQSSLLASLPQPSEGLPVSLSVSLSQQTQVSQCKVRTAEPWKSIPEP